MFSQLLADRQSQTGAAALTGSGGIRLGKFTEDSAMKVECYPQTLVRYVNAYSVFCVVRIEPHGLTRVGELDRIGEEVIEYLP